MAPDSAATRAVRSVEPLSTTITGPTAARSRSTNGNEASSFSAGIITTTCDKSQQLLPAECAFSNEAVFMAPRIQKNVESTDNTGDFETSFPHCLTSYWP